MLVREDSFPTATLYQHSLQEQRARAAHTHRDCRVLTGEPATHMLWRFSHPAHADNKPSSQISAALRTARSLSLTHMCGRPLPVQVAVLLLFASRLAARPRLVGMGNKCIMMTARRPNCRVLSRLALLLTVNIRPCCRPLLSLLNRFVAQATPGCCMKAVADETTYLPSCPCLCQACTQSPHG